MVVVWPANGCRGSQVSLRHKVHVGKIRGSVIPEQYLRNRLYLSKSIFKRCFPRYMTCCNHQYKHLCIHATSIYFASSINVNAHDPCTHIVFLIQCFTNAAEMERLISVVNYERPGAPLHRAHSLQQGAVFTSQYTSNYISAARHWGDITAGCDRLSRLDWSRRRVKLAAFTLNAPNPICAAYCIGGLRAAAGVTVELPWSYRGVTVELPWSYRAARPSPQVWAKRPQREPSGRSESQAAVARAKRP